MCLCDGVLIEVDYTMQTVVTPWVFCVTVLWQAEKAVSLHSGINANEKEEYENMDAVMAGQKNIECNVDLH